MLSKRVILQVITYRTADAEAKLDALFDSLSRVVAPEGGWGIVVIDNPSPLGSMREYLEAHILPRAGKDLPEVTCLFSDANDGYAGGHNRGWKLSRKTDPEYVYLLNDDTFVDPEVLVNAVQVAEENPQAAVVQSRIMLAKSPALLNSSGNCLQYLGFGYSDGSGETPQEAAQHPRPHFYASGAGVLLRCKAIDAIGGLFFDTFMYHEDVDVCWRARLAGYTITYAEDSVVFHDYEFSRSMKKFYWMERNRYLTNLVNYRLTTLMVIFPMALLVETGAFLYAVKSGWWKEKVRAWIFFLRPSTWHEIYRRRCLVAGLRIISDRTILSLMVDTIEAQHVRRSFVNLLANPFLRVYGRFLRFVIR